MMTILAICLTIWLVSLLISVFKPSFIGIETYLFFDGLALAMPFIIVVGSIIISAIGGVIYAVV